MREEISKPGFPMRDPDPDSPEMQEAARQNEREAFALKWCAWCGKFGDHQSGGCDNLHEYLLRQRIENEKKEPE